MERNIHTFLESTSAYSESTAVIFGAPFDGTTSYRPGARFAPASIRSESYGIESYSPYQNKDLLDIKVYDGGDLELCFGNPAKALKAVSDYAAKLFSDAKIPFMLGGEHLVTLGAVSAALKKYPDLQIVCFDAHADLRDDYLGEKLSHATVMRRCHELTGDGRIHQFGIRSGERAEFIFAEHHVNMCKFTLDGSRRLPEILKGKPVYLTIDLDVLDPSVMPGTGTPEAGGVTFTELLAACAHIPEIVAADIVELSPALDHSGASTALACKLLRELLLRFSGS